MEALMKFFWKLSEVNGEISKNVGEGEIITANPHQQKSKKTAVGIIAALAENPIWAQRQIQANHFLWLTPQNALIGHFTPKIDQSPLIPIHFSRGASSTNCEKL